MTRDPRYSRIKEAAKLQDALTNYHNYLQSQLTANPPTGSPTNRGEYTPLYAKPFAYDLGANPRVRESALAQSWTDYKTHFANRTNETAPSPADLIRIRNYKLPRVSIYKQYQQTGTYNTSQVTNLTYINYGGKTVTVPFGQDTTAGTPEKVSVAFNAIRTALEGVSATPPLKIYLIPEKS